jgi:hypothetical protein
MEALAYYFFLLSVYAVQLQVIEEMAPCACLLGDPVLWCRAKAVGDDERMENDLCLGPISLPQLPAPEEFQNRTFGKSRPLLVLERYAATASEAWATPSIRRMKRGIRSRIGPILKEDLKRLRRA